MKLENIDNKIEKNRKVFKKYINEGLNILIFGNKLQLAYKESGYETLILQTPKPPMDNENSLVIKLIMNKHSSIQLLIIHYLIQLIILLKCINANKIIE
ncbi:unnamed protein product [Paramecium sonneborni]|uniref:Uncharacterized protein n=1 Tax=Paramecium sonneborni TaxID=65129 RepID=A0A8S1PYA8_9CILI|nr:unnamed protein product [Paramecium sonneborni]